MSKSLNQCNFIGRLGSDPEIRYTPSGAAVANMSIACSDDYKDKSGAKIEQTNWIRVVAFNKLAEIIAQYVKKGDPIYISGKQVTRKWKNQTGEDQYTTEIVANQMQMLGGKEKTQESGFNQQPDQQQTQQPSPAQGGAYDDFDDQSIPY